MLENFAGHVALTMAAAFTLSAGYEIYRATCRTGVSPYDSWKSFAGLVAIAYLPAAILIIALLSGTSWSVPAALLFVIASILVSILYYNPKVLPQRRPEIVDWVESLVFTGLLFVAAAMLLYHLLEKSALH